MNHAGGGQRQVQKQVQHLDAMLCPRIECHPSALSKKPAREDCDLFFVCTILKTPLLRHSSHSTRVTHVKGTQTGGSWRPQTRAAVPTVGFSASSSLLPRQPRTCFLSYRLSHECMCTSPSGSFHFVQCFQGSSML